MCNQTRREKSKTIRNKKIAVNNEILVFILTCLLYFNAWHELISIKRVYTVKKLQQSNRSTDRFYRKRF